MFLRLLATTIAAIIFATTPLSAKEKGPNEATKKALLNYPVINVKNLTEEMVLAFMEGSPNVILEFSKGTLIPLNTSLEGNVINILPKDRGPIYFSIEQTLYIAFTDEDTFFSEDMNHWRQASAFFSGDINFSIDTGPDGLSINIGGQIHH